MVGFWALGAFSLQVSINEELRSLKVEFKQGKGLKNVYGKLEELIFSK